MEKLLIYFLLLYSAIVAGQDTISYTYGGCTDEGLKLASDNSCPQGIFFEYENDSLTVFGTIGTNYDNATAHKRALCAQAFYK